MILREATQFLLNIKCVSIGRKIKISEKNKMFLNIDITNRENDKYSPGSHEVDIRLYMENICMV